MRKKLISLVLAALMMIPGAAAAHADENVLDLDSMGIRMEYPKEFNELQGYLMPYPTGLLSRDPDVFYMTFDYFSMSKERLEELQNMKAEEFTEEDSKEFMTALTELCMVLVCEGGEETLLDVMELEEIPEDMEVTAFATVDDLVFYYIIKNKRAAERLEEPYASEYKELQPKVLELLQNAELSVPVDPAADLVGQKVSFETTDLEGNPVSSEELFAQNEITMINYWGTWCHFCVEEMPELAEIHTRLQEKGCGIIGILQDGDDPEKLDLAKEIVEENGVNYPNVTLSESMAFLDNVSSFPTSFFVDREGRILSYPINGAAVDLYEETIDKLLKGESADMPAEPDSAAKDAATDDAAADDAAANDAGVYRITVKDTEGNPVSGAAIQFCDDSTCTIGKTDDSGVATFDMPEKVYDVHVLKVPEGYEKDSEEYHTLEEYSDLVITLDKAA